jgi:hypothetical protein
MRARAAFVVRVGTEPPQYWRAKTRRDIRTLARIVLELGQESRPGQGTRPDAQGGQRVRVHYDRQQAGRRQAARD